jgi:competence ComEA-like helix-hairpin-helix protein
MPVHFKDIMEILNFARPARWAMALAMVMLISLFGSRIVAQEAQEDKERQEENRKVAATLPDGDGKTILLARCVQCHGLARVSSGKKSLKSWINTIKVMAINGATIEDKEVEPLAQFLAANYALPVDINSAGAAELSTVPGIEPSLASAIVRYREKNGAFAAVRDLERVEGTTAELLGKISPRLTVGAPPAKPDKKE